MAAPVVTAAEAAQVEAGAAKDPAAAVVVAPAAKAEEAVAEEVEEAGVAPDKVEPARPASCSR